MAYIKPAVQVYQELINAGGAQQLNPDMAACIVGPLFTVIKVDVADELSKVESIGSSQPDSQVDSSYSITPANGEKTYINFSSAKPGQKLDTSSIAVTAKDALVKTYEFVSAVDTAAGDPIDLEPNSIGNVSASAGTPLSFYSSVNHVSLGDTVTVDAETSYITEVDYIAGTIVLNDSSIAVAVGSIVTVYHKFGSITVGSADIDLDDGSISYDDVSPLEASDDPLLTGYTMWPEAEIEGSGDDLSLYIGYTAQRADLSGRVLTISDVDDLIDQLGEVSSSNPLAYGVSLALANSGGTAINAIALDPNMSESLAHVQATELAQAQRLYLLAPLTQQLSTHATYLAHANAMSLPSSANWRVALTNCALPEEDYLYGIDGTEDVDGDGIPDGLKKVDVAGTLVSLGRGESAPSVKAGDYLRAMIVVGGEATGEYLTSAPVDSTAGSNIVLSSAEWTDKGGNVVVPDPVSYVYAARPATKQGQADWVAAQADTWNSNRMWMFPGNVYIPNEDGLDEELPGYYLLAALAGFISGTPAQQPITNITIAGISDLLHGNFYFTEAQMNKMAEQGTLLYAQNAQGTTPYCRHGLTTDVSVLEYREILKVKNWDYLSYYYKDILDPFIGSWNITPDTLQSIRQSVTSASENLLTRKLPKIGAPLLSYNISKLVQSATSADAIELDMAVAIVNPNNYTNVHLQI